MHPSLVRYVDPPRHTAGYFVLGTIAGTLGLVAAVELTSLVQHASGLDSPATEHTCEYDRRLASRARGVEDAQISVKRYAFVAFPRWAADHPSLACPARLTELTPYVDENFTIDPWGRSYQFACQGAGIWVRSAGPDRTYDTDDDIRSDR